MMRSVPTRLLRTAAAVAWLGAVACGEARQTPELPNPEPVATPEASRPAAQSAEAAEDRAVREFLKVWRRDKPVFKNRFLGVRTFQNPLDAWIIQEIIVEVAPDYIVEAGTFHGGSAALWALILENVNPKGRVITIDIEDQREARAVSLPISQRRVDFLLGSSTAPEIVAEVERRVRGKKVLVILDSLHTKEHVAAELRAYAPLVSVGSYLIVQDTPVGPIHAIDEFLAGSDSFVVDRERERFRITNTIGGYLRRVRPQRTSAAQ